MYTSNHNPMLAANRLKDMLAERYDATLADADRKGDSGLVVTFTLPADTDMDDVRAEVTMWFMFDECYGCINGNRTQVSDNLLIVSLY